jgi:small subunit ribosomal protein S16
MSVRIRMKKMGRKHRPYFRICAMDIRSPRDGKVLEELGTYDPLVVDTHARAVLKRERVDYWIGVGAQPSDKVAVLIKKYGTNGKFIGDQEAALARLAEKKPVPPAPTPVELPKKPEPVVEAPPEVAEAAAEAPADAPAETAAEG